MRTIMRLATMAATLALTTAVSAAPASAGPFGPAVVRNPYVAAGFGSTMHADTASSGASGWAGPGLGRYSVKVNTLGAACPTVLVGSDDIPVALCTKIAGEAPVVYLLDPGTGNTLASLSFTSTAKNVFGGVYTYLDQYNRLVFFDPDGDLVRIAHTYANGKWTLSAQDTVHAGATIDTFCAAVCGGVVGIAPDYAGNVWFATTDGVVGFVTPSGATDAIRLGAGEQVANSISTVPGGTAISTDHALYLLNVSRGQPHVIWRYAYDRGPSRKPGQLSWGTGSTPVFFGPSGAGSVDGSGPGGDRYLTITDNAAPAEHLLVFDTWSITHHTTTVTVRHGKRKVRRRRTVTRYGIATTPKLICDRPVLTPGPSGTENAPVASGTSVFVASTYGYPYPASPAGQPDPSPKTAPFTGGVTRVDISGGCHVVWQDGVRSAAVPRLDTQNGVLYTVSDVDPLSASDTGLSDTYSEVALDAGTGAVLDTNALGTGYQANTLQLSPTIIPGDVMFQGTVTGVVREGPQ